MAGFDPTHCLPHSCEWYQHPIRIIMKKRRTIVTHTNRRCGAAYIRGWGVRGKYRSSLWTVSMLQFTLYIFLYGLYSTSTYFYTNIYFINYDHDNIIAFAMNDKASSPRRTWHDPTTVQTILAHTHSQEEGELRTVQLAHIHRSNLSFHSHRHQQSPCILRGLIWRDVHFLA
jgi:hypothetical protein